MPDIVITEFMDEAAVESLRAEFDVHYDPQLVGSPQEIARLGAAARALIVRNRTRVNRALLEALPRLVAVGRLGVGLDNIDLPACRERGIAVLPATGANDDSVAEYVIAGALMMLRGAYFSTPAMVAGAWPRERLMGREAAGKTLGLVGFGRIARAVATRARALGMTVVGYDPFVAADDPAWTFNRATSVPMNELLAGSDVVSLHLPLTEETRRMIDAVAIGRMKRGAILINAARGGIVDEAALAAALRSGHLGGAMVDVFETEPLGPDNPFADVPNLVLTPHIAGVTVESNERVSAVTAENVRRALSAAGTATGGRAG